VQNQFAFFRPGLLGIFPHFSSEDTDAHAIVRSRGERASRSGGGAGGSLSGTGLSHFGGSRVPATRAVNTMKEALSYGAFYKLCQSFDLCSPPITLISHVELGDIFLCSLSETAAGPGGRLRGLSYLEFQEALLRLALVAFRDRPISTLDKLMGLFHYMWRSITTAVPMAWSDQRSSTSTTDAGALLHGTRIFNKLFTEQWMHEGRRNYLEPEPEAPQTGLNMLRMMSPPGRAAGCSSSSGGGGGGEGFGFESRRSGGGWQ